LIVHIIKTPQLTLYAHIKTTEQQTIIQQCSYGYTGRWWVGCYIWYRDEGCGPAQSPPHCTKCNSSPVTDQCTNFILFSVALWL